MLLDIEVTREDILDGRQGKVADCPIALASHRAICETVGCRDVTISDVMVVEDKTYGGRYREFKLPNEAQDFVKAFDQTCHCGDFEKVDGYCYNKDCETRKLEIQPIRFSIDW